MSGLVKLVWYLKEDRGVSQYVYGVHDAEGIEGLRSLARLLHKSGICSSIQIVADGCGSVLEDYAKGHMRTSTDIFNEQLAEVLERPGGPHEREQKLKEEVKRLKEQIEHGL
ncbi:MAG TPA: hypothetical protein VMV58_05360 [Desulfosporosinus sp.]|nr:hypothetical protein [Desulfosporosinus sp.]